MRTTPLFLLTGFALGVSLLAAQEKGPEGEPPLPDPIPFQVEVEVQGEGQIEIEVEVQGEGQIEIEVEVQGGGQLEGKPGLKIEIPAPAAGGPKAPGFLGVSAAELPAALADQLKLDHGVRLTEVNADSPAGEAGFEVDDIILGVNGKQVENMLQLRDAITAHKQGDEVTLKLIQKGKQVEKKVTLAARPALPQIVLPPGVFQGGGIQIVPNGIQRLQRFGLGEDGFKMRDNDGSVEVTGEVEGREVTVWDLSNKIIYEGPWVTPQDKAAPPDNMRRRIERVEKTFALRLQRQPFALPQRVPNPAPRPRVRPKVEEDPKPKGKDGEPEE